MAARWILSVIIAGAWAALPGDAADAAERTAAAEDAAPPRPQQVYVVPFSHLDLAYLGPPHSAAARFERILSAALGQLERDPQFRFTIENASFLDRYLQVRPEAREAIEAALAEGRLDLCAQWADILQNPATAEDLVRNLLLAVNLARSQFHFRPRAVIAADIPGLTPQVAQVWARAGLAGAMLSRGGPPQTPLFDWLAPDGSKIRIGFSVRGYAAGWMVGLADSLEAAEGRRPVVTYHSVREKELQFSGGLLKYLDECYPAKGPALLGAGPDLSFPPTRMAEIARQWNQGHADRATLHVATLPEYLRAVAGEKVPELRGDLQSVWQTASLSVERQATMARSAHQLLAAEKLAALASLLTPVEYPAAEIEAAWGWHLVALDHEGAALPDYPQRVQQVAEEVQQRAARAIAGRIPTASRDAMVLVAMNPLGWARRVLLQVPLYLHGDIPSDARRWRQIVVQDESGQVLPARLCRTAPFGVGQTAELTLPVDLPAAGYRAIVLEPAGEGPADSERVAAWEAPRWEDDDPRQPCRMARGRWSVQYEPEAQALAVACDGTVLLRSDVVDLARGEGARGLLKAHGGLAWRTVRHRESWAESLLRVEGETQQDNVAVWMEVRLREASLPEIASGTQWPAGTHRQLIQRLRPAAWRADSLRYGVPFGEEPFGSAVPGSGPSTAGDERPAELWKLLKEFDGWLAWTAGPAQVTLATEARGAVFPPGMICFVMMPKSGTLPKPFEQITLRQRLDCGDGDPAAWRPQRAMWELLEEPVTAVAEDRFAAQPLPASRSLLSWSDPRLVVTAMRSDGPGRLVVRTYAHAAVPVTAKLDLALPVESLEEISPLEESLGPASGEHRFRPWEIYTLRAQFRPLKASPNAAGKPAG